MDIFDYRYCQDERATIKFSPIFKTKKEFTESDFVKKICDFVSSKEEDFMDWGELELKNDYSVSWS